MAKTHKTAQGKTIDMDSLRAKNEEVRAVGNMRINARGDVIDAYGRVINDNTKRVNEQYMKSVRPKNIIPNRPSEKPVVPTPLKPEVAKPDSTPTPPVTELTSEELKFNDEDMDFVRPEISKTTKSKSSKKLD
jgi:hypothetical protein